MEERCIFLQVPRVGFGSFFLQRIRILGPQVEAFTEHVPALVRNLVVGFEENEKHGGDDAWNHFLLPCARSHDGLLRVCRTSNSCRGRRVLGVKLAWEAGRILLFWASSRPRRKV